jgi:hypothetical protein
MCIGYRKGLVRNFLYKFFLKVATLNCTELL